jgi:hypothetical protein
MERFFRVVRLQNPFHNLKWFIRCRNVTLCKRISVTKICFTLKLQKKCYKFVTKPFRKSVLHIRKWKCSVLQTLQIRFRSVWHSLRLNMRVGKSGKNGKPFRFTYGTNNLEMIPLIKIWGWSNHLFKSFVFSILAPWWPSQKSDRTEPWSGRSCDLEVHTYKVSGE